MSMPKDYPRYLSAVENYLAGLFAAKPHWADLYESMRYSLLSGGKRLRPVMALAFAELAGERDLAKILPCACAVELVHTYSLIHDDLPCMDDDDLRRGRPTNHKVYGETLAVLAGDALQCEAFRLALSAPIDDNRRCRCAAILAEAAGADGMVAGQVLDTLHAPATMDDLREVHALKTGAMIAAACRIGVAAAGGDAAMEEAAKAYALKVGLAFQIRDDLLDVIGDEAVFGKPIGSDAREGKCTCATLLGVEGCEREIRRLTDEACAEIAAYPGSAFLTELAETLASRSK